MTRSEFEAAIRVFLREFSPVVLSAPPEAFAHLDLRRELKEARSLVIDKGATDAMLVGIAGGVVDSFVLAEWERVIDNAYSSFSSDYRAD